MSFKRINALIASIAILFSIVPNLYRCRVYAEETNDEYYKVLSFGHSYTSVIKSDNSLYTWGRNEEGVLGRGTNDYFFGSRGYTVAAKSRINNPEKLAANIVTADFGINDHAAYINENHELYMWGRNSEGQLGTGDYVNRLSPAKIMNNVKSVSLGNTSSAALTCSGELYLWGSSLCRDENGEITYTDTPQKAMENVDHVSLCGSSIAVITKDGCLYTWGQNEFGEVGNGTDSPVMLVWFVWAVHAVQRLLMITFSICGVRMVIIKCLEKATMIIMLHIR